MPHFVIDCSENIIKIKTPSEIMQVVYDTAEATELFDKGDIKVRINPYCYFNNGNSDQDFIHIFAYIMEGRSMEKKANLSKKIVGQLKMMFPDVPILSMNIKDFERETYANKGMV
jgi:5-carboxymethyl-2-hydroxymuconate isomerase